MKSTKFILTDVTLIGVRSKKAHRALGRMNAGSTMYATNIKLYINVSEIQCSMFNSAKDLRRKIYEFRKYKGYLDTGIQKRSFTSKWITGSIYWNSVYPVNERGVLTFPWIYLIHSLIFYDSSTRDFGILMHIQLFYEK